jgi:hypothetical protein
MDNIIIDQRIHIQHLEQENEALKKKIVLMYENWQYDNRRFQELKEQLKKIELTLTI